jgi:hypothetical protein
MLPEGASAPPEVFVAGPDAIEGTT